MTTDLQITDKDVSSGASVLQIILRASRDESIDIVKFEKLMELYDKVDKQRRLQAFNEAMSEAQGKLGRVSADAANPQTRSKYASYAQLDRALRPVYVNEGFALSFDTGDAILPEYVRVLCNVSHRDGHVHVYHLDMPADGKGAKGGDVMTKTHAVGSGVSYGMRYLLKMIFNIAVGEEDDDGNSAGSSPQFLAWRDKIQNAKDMLELENAGGELAAAQIVPHEKTELRGYYSQRKKELEARGTTV